MDETIRESLFIQTKFTHVGGQDHRLPYDKDASVYDQVHQSFASSLKHLDVAYLDSYLLHGPSVGGPELGPADYDAWRAMTEIYAKQNGTLALGISNVNHEQLLDLIHSGEQLPHYVQNRYG
jgi:diketogulonate reductase-like aldo/keto reductase